MNPQQRRQKQIEQIKENKIKIDKNEFGLMVSIGITILLAILNIFWTEYRTHSSDECKEACCLKVTVQKSTKERKQ